MPRIPKKFISTVFFMYPSVDDAKKGASCGGTGFFVTVPSQTHQDHQYLYAVTNWHVACRGSSVIRFNTATGGTKFINLGPDEWEFDSNVGADIAAVSISESEIDDDTRQLIAPIGVGAFAPEDGDDIGVGEDVFMVGRFLDYDGGKTNVPSSRFGCISTMPVPVRQGLGKNVNSYCIDMRSRSGYSGSPVFVYRTPGTDIEFMEETHLFDTGRGFLYFLGIHVSQFEEKLEYIDEAGVNRVGKGLSGMTTVAPASMIKDILMMDKFKYQREADDAARDFDPSVPEPESANRSDR